MPVACPSGHGYALTLEYDGTDFSGWQRQPGRRTVEAELRRAVAAATGETAPLTAAGRTDAGAHAHGQVVGLRLSTAWEPSRLGAATNAHLPEDVVVVAARSVPASFHARFDAVSRAYRYLVTPRAQRQAVARQYTWQVRGPLDVAAMRQAAGHLVGRRDLRALGRSPRPGGHTTRMVSSVDVRLIELPAAAGAAAQPSRSVVVIDVVADAFLYGMMRNIAGALVAVGRGRSSVEEFAALSNGEGTHRPPVTAPAHGLHQWQVSYA
jgi:tRNA pseudouridine38-40 synthase